LYGIRTRHSYISSSAWKRGQWKERFEIKRKKGGGGLFRKVREWDGLSARGEGVPTRGTAKESDEIYSESGKEKSKDHGLGLRNTIEEWEDSQD